MGEVAMWSAISAIGVALVGAVAGFLEKNRRQDAAIQKLREEHSKCQEERAELRTVVGTEWPSDDDSEIKFVRAMKAIRDATGMKPTMAQCAMIAKNIRNAKKRSA